jgi:hypothetical protein
VEKKSFVLRVDEEMFAALSKWAADDFRSVNGQLEWLLHQALKDAGRLPKPKERAGAKPKK